MRYIYAFLLASILFAIGSSLYIYHGNLAHDHNHEMHEGNVYEKDDVVVDFFKSINRNGREKIVCYRESHRNFYIFIFQLSIVIVALTSYGIFTKVRLSKRLQKQNFTLEESRAALNKSNQQLLSGIRYAQRLQQAMLPKLRVLNDLTDKHFLLYQPKDLVSGDFFWIGKIDHRTIICTADSTGHGVPGAFLATLGLNTVRNVIEAGNLWQPSQILERVNTSLAQSLGKTNEIDNTDGIEMTIFSIDPTTQTATFAGARGVALLYTEGNIVEFKGDRITLGHNEHSTFTETAFSYNTGDWFLQFTDGIVDQFGGPEGKKFSRSRLKEVLKGMAAQPNVVDLEKVFVAWKGKEEQVDDVLVISYQT